MLTLKGLPFPACLSRHLRPAAKTLQTRPIWTCLDCWRQLASVCTSDFQSGLLPHIQVQKTILLKAMLHKNLPGIVNPAVSPVYSIPESFFPQSTSFLGQIWRGAVFALSLRTNHCVLRLWITLWPLLLIMTHRNYRLCLRSGSSCYCYR